MFSRGDSSGFGGVHREIDIEIAHSTPRISLVSNSNSSEQLDDLACFVKTCRPASQLRSFLSSPDLFRRPIATRVPPLQEEELNDSSNSVVEMKQPASRRAVRSNGELKSLG